MKNIVKIFVIVSILKGYSFYAMHEGLGREAIPEPKETVVSKEPARNWWSSVTDRFAKKTSVVSEPKSKSEATVAPTKSQDGSTQTGLDLSQGPDAAKSSSDQNFATSQSSSNLPKVSVLDDSAVTDKKSARKGSKKHQESSENSDNSSSENLDEKVDEVNRDYDLMNKTKNSLFEEFSMLKSDRGILNFKNLREADIASRVKKSVDDISAKVGLNSDQEKLLQSIVVENLVQIQRKLKNKLIAQTPEDVARALFSGAEHDDRWSQFAFKDVQQRYKFEDYVMSRAETMKHSSLLEDYLRICSSMATNAEDAARDAREIGEFTQDSVINKVKVGVYRTKAGLYMAANPCILAVFTLGIVGEFIYGKV